MQEGMLVTTLNDPAAPAEGSVTLLPGPDLVGTTSTWSLPGSDGVLLVVRADFIGWASSRTASHWDHRPGTFASVSTRCRACRWFEPRIFREVRDPDDPDPERYLVHSAGMTAVPGEHILTKHAWALSADEVLDLLSTSRDKPQTPSKCPICGGSGAEQNSTKDQPRIPCHSCGGRGIVFGPSKEIHFSVPARRVIAQAAGLDEELSEAKTRRGM